MKLLDVTLHGLLLLLDYVGLGEIFAASLSLKRAVTFKSCRGFEPASSDENLEPKVPDLEPK